MAKLLQDLGGLVFSTNPDWRPESAEPDAPPLLPPEKQQLIISLDRRQRAGKKVTLVQGFQGPGEALEDLGRQLKTHCGAGGNAKEGIILIQGDFRDKILSFLQQRGYRAKRGN